MLSTLTYFYWYLGLDVYELESEFWGFRTPWVGLETFFRRFSLASRSFALRNADWSNGRYPNIALWIGKNPVSTVLVSKNLSHLSPSARLIYYIDRMIAFWDATVSSMLRKSCENTIVTIVHGKIPWFPSQFFPVDGCEILHQLVNGKHPISLSLFLSLSLHRNLRELSHLVIRIFFYWPGPSGNLTVCHWKWQLIVDLPNLKMVVVQ